MRFLHFIHDTGRFNRDVKTRKSKRYVRLSLHSCSRCAILCSRERKYGIGEILLHFRPSFNPSSKHNCLRIFPSSLIQRILKPSRNPRPPPIRTPAIKDNKRRLPQNFQPSLPARVKSMCRDIHSSTDHMLLRQCQSNELGGGARGNLKVSPSDIYDNVIPSRMFLRISDQCCNFGISH